MLQATRLLGLSYDKIVLFENNTKVVTKSQNTQDLLQVSMVIIVIRTVLLVILQDIVRRNVAGKILFV